MTTHTPTPQPLPLTDLRVPEHLRPAPAQPAVTVQACPPRVDHEAQRIAEALKRRMAERGR